MALIHKNAFKKIIKNTNFIHKNVDTTYTVFDKEGKTFFQIDTYGSATREIPSKVSQSLQLDQEMAKVLVSELQKAFKFE